MTTPNILTVIPLRIANKDSALNSNMERGGFPHHLEILRYQLGVLPFNSIQTPSTLR